MKKQTIYSLFLLASFFNMSCGATEQIKKGEMKTTSITVCQSDNTHQTIDNTTGRPLPASTKIKPGIYQHYKGNYYLVFFVSLDTETLQETVVYQSLYGDFRIWSRPLAMFLETVTYQGNKQPRFQWIAESSKTQELLLHMSL